MTQFTKYPHIDSYLVGLKKKIGIEQNLSAIDTLILGSSHGQYSYVPQKNEYNLCLPSQDLYYSYSLYKKYFRRLKNLQTIVLFYSVFSQGFELIKSRENFRCYGYEQIFGIKPYHRNFSLKLHDEYDVYLPSIQLSAQKLKVPCKYRGENPDKKGKNVKRIGQIDPVERVSKAFKHNQRSSRQNKYVKKFIAMAEKNNQHIVIVLSAAHNDYKNALPPEGKIFADIFNIVKEYPHNVSLIDFYQRNDFTDDDWWDYDHLNPQGAIKFTEIYHRLNQK